MPYGFGGGARMEGTTPRGVWRGAAGFFALGAAVAEAVGAAVGVVVAGGASLPNVSTVGPGGGSGAFGVGVGVGGGAGVMTAGAGFFGSSVETAYTAAAVRATTARPTTTMRSRIATLDFFGSISTGAMLRIGPRPLATSCAV